MTDSNHGQVTASKQMVPLRFYRGIAVPSVEVEETVASIVSGGLHAGRGHRFGEQSWGLPIESLLNKRDLCLSDTRNSNVSRPATYACGTVEGAEYYAWEHNQNAEKDTPVIIEFEAQLDRVAIDGKDFLYTVFQCEPQSSVRNAIELAFGPRILTYAEVAWASDVQERRVALCDLASLDPEAIRDHHANRDSIGGRFNTVFDNAFTVALPVLPEHIVRVWSPKNRPHRRLTHLTLRDILMRPPAEG